MLHRHCGVCKSFLCEFTNADVDFVLTFVLTVDCCLSVHFRTTTEGVCFSGLNVGLFLVFDLQTGAARRL